MKLWLADIPLVLASRTSEHADGAAAARQLDWALPHPNGWDEPALRRDLLSVCRELDGAFLDGDRWSTAELRERVIRAAESGQILLAARERVAVSAAAVPKPPPPLVAPGGAAAEKDAWLEIELVDDDGKPYAGRVEIQLADGDRITRSTNELGLLRLDGIRPGTCKVRLLGLDPSAWEAA